MAGGKAAKRKTVKRKTAKRTPAVKPKSPKKKSAKRVTAKRKSAKSQTVKSKTAKRKTAKRKSPKSKAPKRASAKRASTAKPKNAKKKKSTKKKVPKKKSAAKKRPVKKSGAKKRSAVKNVLSAAKKASKSKKSASKIEKIIFSELEALAGYIQDAKIEISSLNPNEVKDDFLPMAEIELSAIVEATAEATHAIMDACEGLEEVMSGLEGEAASTLMNSTTKIYEACTFQDITGQRINKVVTTLQHIERRIDRLISVFDIKIDKPASVKKEEQIIDEGGVKVVSDEDLLEGPQLKGQGSSQAEIDDLLASFD